MRRYTESFWEWLGILISGTPHFTIGDPERPYMLRWYLIPRNRWLNIYLHKIVRDDDDRALHDHPWWFISFMLKGGYVELLDGDREIERHAPSVAFRSATHRHRVRLFLNNWFQSIPCWTVVITGPKAREWGFWCPQGFVHWQEFVEPNAPGEIGRGCGENF